MAQDEEKKKLIEEKNIHLWFVGSPLVLCSMKLELDLKEGAMFAYSRFMNVQPETINSVVCDYICYDSVRNVVDVMKDCTYYDVDMKRNCIFGGEIPFRVKNNQTRNIEVVLRSVTTYTGQTWVNEENHRFDISFEQESIINVQKNLNREFIDCCAAIDVDHTKLILQPQFREEYWLCACSALNWSDEEVCCNCGVTKQWLTKCINLEYLQSRADYKQSEAEKIKAEAEAREALEKERQRAEFEKRKKSYADQQKAMEHLQKLRRILPVLVIIAVLLLGGVTFWYFGMPYVRYQDALSDISNGNYDTAIEKLSDMKNFLDADKQLQKAIYGKAMELLYDRSNDENAAESARLFRSIMGYSDANDKYIEALITAGDVQLANRRYMSAADIYKEAGDQAKNKLRKCYQQIYRQAQNDLKKQHYRPAYNKFSYLADYKDCADRAKDCLYKIAAMDYANRKYKDALNKYEQIRGYSDVDDIMKKLSYLNMVLSASDGSETPAVWNAADMKNPENGKKVEYVFEFYGDGKYVFTIVGEKEKDNLSKTGNYKIEDKKIYYSVIKDGMEKWKTLSTIKFIRESSEIEGKNTCMNLTDPFDKDNGYITLYGNIISGETVNLS